MSPPDPRRNLYDPDTPPEAIDWDLAFSDWLDHHEHDIPEEDLLNDDFPSDAMHIETCASRNAAGVIGMGLRITTAQGRRNASFLTAMQCLDLAALLTRGVPVAFATYDPNNESVLLEGD